jgi:hypothetical protein
LSLKRLQAKCQTGISYREYRSAVGDAKFAVNLFIEGTGAQKYPELATSMNETMKHYEYAGNVWSKRFSEDAGIVSKGLIPVKSELGMEIKSIYPQVNEIEASGDYRYYYMDSTISVIWGKASEALQKTETFNSDIVEKTAGREAPLKNENADLKSQIDKLKEEIATLKKSRSKAR